MLESKFIFPIKAEDAYQLELCKDANWGSAKKRVLIIFQTVDNRDLKAGAMLGDRAVMTCFKNALKYTRGIIRTYNENAVEAAYGVINSNSYKHLHLSPGPRKQAEAEFAKRCHKIIAKLKPTHVFVSGDEAMQSLWPSVEHSNYKRGWVHLLKSGDLDLKVTSTLDFARLLEKDGQYANLLGFWCRHFANLMLGRDPHFLGHIKAEPKYIATIEQFDGLMARLYKSELIAIDTECRDLSVLFNAVYTIQFATEDNPLVGYVLPIRHPMTTWTKEEIKYIRVTLRKFFSMKKRKELVFFNGMFDLRIIRRELKLPIIWHNVWEITSGEHLLDENISELNNFGAKPGGLAAVYCSYGNDHYMTAKFSKGERTTIGNVKPNDPDFLLYAATDVVSLLAIRKQQIAKAGHQTIEGHNYGPYFVRHMLHQMSDTAHQLSHMREDGSLIDAKYLRFLTSPESPIRLEMAKLNRAFKIFPEAVEANKRILSASGLKAKGLFAKSKFVNWALSLRKSAHLRVMFFDVMGLEPVSKTKTGELSTDKFLVAQYKDKHPIVEAYGEYAKLATLLSSYAKGWYKKLRSDRDSVEDSHLRPDYSSFDVTTGRLASKKPSLHTIPSRGSLVKIIKRMFISPRGKLLVRFDYSAHEVRVWSYVSMDMVLAAVFKIGQKLRQQFIQDPSEKNAKAIKEKGDLHILNVYRLFGKMVDKSHPLRDAVKAVIFGLLYGMSPESLGNQTKLGEINTLKEKINKLYDEIAILEKA